MDSLKQDLSYGVRLLLRRLGFTLPAVATLALGIGATTALFSLLNGVVLTPLPYRSPEKLVMLWETKFSGGLDHERVSPVNFLDYRALGEVFEDAAAWWEPQLNLTDTAGEPVRVKAIEVSGNLFSVMGVTPLTGRGFSPGLNGPEGEIVISFRFWQSRYGGDADAIGRDVRLNDRPYTIVGVMPPGFQFPGGTDVWQRLRWNLADHSRYAHFMEAVGRLKPGATLDFANRELGALSARLGREYPPSNREWGARAVYLQREIVGFFEGALFVLFAAVAVLLLLACTNVASLLLARASAREREVAMRTALGASRGRLLSQFLTESLLLGGTGAALGLFLAWAAVRILQVQRAVAIPRLAEVSINGEVLAFTIAVTLFTTFLFGLAPAASLARMAPMAALREGGRGVGGGSSRGRARRILVAGEVALAVLLVVGAGLLIRSFVVLLSEKPGFNPARVATVNVELPSPRQATPSDWARVSQFYGTLLESLKARPSVEATGATNSLPLVPSWRVSFVIPGRAFDPAEEPQAQHVTVTPDYFKVLGIPLLRGRFLDSGDGPDSRGVVLINQEMARRFWPNEDPVGRVITTRSRNIGPLGLVVLEKLDFEIVGVVGDVKNATLRNDVEPAIFFSYLQFPFKNMHVVVRAQAGPAQVAAWIREDVKRLDPALPLSEARAMEDVVSASVGESRFVTVLMSAFAGLALLLAAVGVYGVLSYTVSQRRQEIGVRLALGARPADLLRRVLGEGLLLAAIGVILGLAAASVFSRFLSSLLFRVGVYDPWTFGAAVLVVLTIALLAGYIPARRASRVDPLVALRE